MITNTGKNILSKYLVGQAPAYASYIAVGCGGTPEVYDSLDPLNNVFSSEQITEFASKESLDFEMFRVPIISRGYVDEDGTPSIVFTAEMPTEDRYEITEVGVFSAGSNPSAGSADSRTIASFTADERWEEHTGTASGSLRVFYTPLDPDEDNVIKPIIYTSPTEYLEYNMFMTNADNRTFTDSTRSNRYERCRFLNNIVAVRGNTASISESGGHLVVDSGSHLHQNNVSLRFDQNAPTDKIKLAFSIANKYGDTSTYPTNAKVIVEFASSDEPTAEYARMEVNLTDGIDHDFQNNRYVVVTQELQDLYRSSGFSWSIVNTMKVYVDITPSVVDSQDPEPFYVLLDALRLENVTDVNPLYGMTGYTRLRTPGAETVIKRANTSSFVEFRFALEV